MFLSEKPHPVEIAILIFISLVFISQYLFRTLRPIIVTFVSLVITIAITMLGLANSAAPEKIASYQHSDYSVLAPN